MCIQNSEISSILIPDQDKKAHFTLSWVFPLGPSVILSPSGYNLGQDHRTPNTFAGECTRAIHQCPYTTHSSSGPQRFSAQFLGGGSSRWPLSPFSMPMGDAWNHGLLVPYSQSFDFPKSFPKMLGVEKRTDTELISQAFVNLIKSDSYFQETSMVPDRADKGQRGSWRFGNPSQLPMGPVELSGKCPRSPVPWDIPVHVTRLPTSIHPLTHSSLKHLLCAY